MTRQDAFRADYKLHELSFFPFALVLAGCFFWWAEHGRIKGLMIDVGVMVALLGSVAAILYFARKGWLVANSNGLQWKRSAFRKHYVSWGSVHMLQVRSGRYGHELRIDLKPTAPDRIRPNDALVRLDLLSCPEEQVISALRLYTPVQDETAA